MCISDGFQYHVQQRSVEPKNTKLVAAPATHGRFRNEGQLYEVGSHRAQELYLRNEES